MTDDQAWNFPPECSVTIAVQMNETWFGARFEIQQPFARCSHIVPRISHPLEFVVALEQLHIGNAPDGSSLLIIEAPAHRRQRDCDIGLSQLSTKFQRISPNAADGIRGH